MQLVTICKRKFCWQQYGVQSLQYCLHPFIACSNSIVALITLHLIRCTTINDFQFMIITIIVIHSDPQILMASSYEWRSKGKWTFNIMNMKMWNLHQTETWVNFYNLSITNRNLHGPSLVSQNLLSFELNNMFSQRACIVICSLIIVSTLLQLFSETTYKFIKSLNALLLW